MAELPADEVLEEAEGKMRQTLMAGGRCGGAGEPGLEHVVVRTSNAVMIVDPELTRRVVGRTTLVWWPNSVTST